MTREEQIAELKENLPQFTGTDHWYRHNINRQITYTDGVKYLAEVAGAYWLIDEIATHNMFTKKVRAEEFQVWRLRVSGSEAKLVCEDGDGFVMFKQKLAFTDFPLPEIELWYENHVIMLPSER